MDVKTLLDYAQFQLSPRRTRCELFVSGDGKTEKLASGLFKPFLTHLRVVEEQASSGVQSINLEFGRRKNGSTWFSKGTLERFVRFVSTPEVLEMVNTYYAEMSQLEGDSKIYSQGAGGQLSGQLGEAETASAAAADVTKKVLLRAIDVRLVALKKDLVTASARASAAGFTLDTVSELLLFSDQFGALRLHDACTKFMLLCEQRPELLGYQQSLSSQWKGFDDDNIRSSGSDMSIDELDMEPADHLKPSTSSSSSTVPKIHKPNRSGHVLQKTTDETKFNGSSLVEKASDKAKEEVIPAFLSNEPPQPAGGGSRRLSVQDRINMFESKQKQQSGSASISSISSSGAGGIKKVVAGKEEHRRLPSDVSMDKSVLRRWSGASDMSIDLNNNSSTSDRKESGSVAGTPTSTVCSQVQYAYKAAEEEASGLKDTATSRLRMGPEDNLASNSVSLPLLQAQVKAFPKDRIPSEDVLRGGITTTFKAQSEQSFEEHEDLQTPFNSSIGRAQQGALIDQAASQVISELVSDSRKGYGVKDPEAIETKFIATSEGNDGSIDQALVQIPSRTVPVTLQGGRAVSTVEVKSQATSMTKFRTFAGKMNADEKAEGPLDSQIHSKTSFGKGEGNTPKNDLPSEHQCKIYPGKQVEAKKEVAVSSQMPLRASSVEVEKESGSQAMNLHERKSASDQIKKVQGRRDVRMPNQGTGLPAISGKHGGEVLEPSSKLSTEKAQMMRSSKGNYELNDELQIKANELEKLFAAHKLRVHGDQMASPRRSKPVDDHALESGERGLLQFIPDQLLERDLPRDRSRSGVESDVNLLRMVDNLNNAKGMQQKFGDHSPSDDSRGTLYEKYTQKRDAKLREDWGMKRAQREANMKAMHDNLVRSQAEMKAKFASSGDKQDSSFARHRVEKMRSFNARSHTKDKGQALELLHVEGEEDLHGLEEAPSGRDRSFSDTLSGNESSTSSKRLVSSKSLSSSSARKTSINSIPRPSARTSNSSSIHRRALPENPLAQSVPNFSEFRKENTKPLTGPSKSALSGQPRAFARSKTTIEESNVVKEEKSHRSHSMRKSLANTGESKNLTPLSSDAANQTSMRFPKEHAHQGINKILKSGESKSFLRKGNGVHPGGGVGIAKMKALTNTKLLNDDEESEVLVDQRDNSLELVKDDEEEFGRTSAEGNFQASEFHQDTYSDGDPGSDNGDMQRSLCHAGDDFAVVSSEFDPSAGTLHDSPGESPRSWNFNTQHSFSYAHDASDVDAFVDSPSGSPASWNSHPLNQIIDTDAARTRKKWGSAQIPVLAANVPNHTRKDVTKGFKRLLNFGRKSKGADYLVNDWVSASTASEGDDDTEDGRELGNRSSEDLRKSRMGYSIPAYDGFNEGDNFPEHVQSLRSSIPDASANFKFREDHLSGSSMKAPRSFFSLSSFRSKGSEPKPR